MIFNRSLLNYSVFRLRIYGIVHEIAVKITSFLIIVESGQT